MSEMRINSGGSRERRLNDEILALQAENAQLREALTVFLETRWWSVDKDNMEFEGRVTCYQLDAAREALLRERP